MGAVAVPCDDGRVSTVSYENALAIQMARCASGSFYSSSAPVHSIPQNGTRLCGLVRNAGEAESLKRLGLDGVCKLLCADSHGNPCCNYKVIKAYRQKEQPQ